MRSALALLALSLSSSVLATPKGGRGRGDNNDSGGGGDNGNKDASSAGASSTATAASASSSGTSGGVSVKGDTVCSDLMCIGALVNSSAVQYTLQSKGAASLGWMAMGFGQYMANSPMIIMWPNSDNSITLSQRKAPFEVMPTVDSSPPRVAALSTTGSSVSGNNPKLSFTIPANTDTTQNIIWAFGTTNPGSSAVDASLIQHLNSGTLSLDLTKTTTQDPTNPAVSPSSGSNNTDSEVSLPPLLPYQKKIVTHAILSAVGFLGLLPAGALLARYSRTFTSVWFTGHWIFQFLLAGPVIIAGVAMGISATSTAMVPHLADTHKKLGVGLLVLYFVQIALGAVIHYVKPESFKINRRRPAQNYVHAVLGLLIIALAFYQTRLGFRTEWPLQTGRGNVPSAVETVWVVWVVLIPVLYFGGLALLRRQFKQERAPKPAPGSDAAHLRDEGEYHD